MSAALHLINVSVLSYTKLQRSCIMSLSGVNTISFNSGIYAQISHKLGSRGDVVVAERVARTVIAKTRGYAVKCDRSHKITYIGKYDKSNIGLAGVGTSLIIGDIEHVLGDRTIILLDHVSRVSADSVQRLLKYCFVNRFFSTADQFNIDAGTLFDVISFFSRSRDLDLFMDYMKFVYDETHFPMTRRLFSLFSKSILYNWYFISKHFGAIGLFMTMSGKLSKQLLTRGQTVRLRVGKTSYGIVKNNVIFRYRQTHSETGAYGLTVYYFVRSNIKRYR